MGIPQIYCSMCGAPIFGTIFRHSEEKKWLADAIILTTAHNTENGSVELDEYFPTNSYPGSQYLYHLGPNPPEESQRLVLRLDAETEAGYNSFKLLPAKEVVKVMTVSYTRGRIPIESRGGALHLPFHRLCLEIADRFALENSRHMSQDDMITSVKQLWEVYYRRVCGSSLPFSTLIMEEPHDYFGGRHCRNVDWEPGDDPQHAELFESNPMEILNLTGSVLHNLEPMPSPANLKGGTSEKLSEGARRNKFNLYYNLQDVDLNCECTYNQDWWCDALLEGKLLPWLWDLDPKGVRKKQSAGHWNWELLVRQLSQLRIHEPGDKYLELPLSLRNRRRIWRLLDGARVGDVAAIHMQKIEANKNK